MAVVVAIITVAIVAVATFTIICLLYCCYLSVRWKREAKSNEIPVMKFQKIDRMVQVGVRSTFTKVFKDAPMRVHAMVAWVVAKFANNCPISQDIFMQNNGV